MTREVGASNRRKSAGEKAQADASRSEPFMARSEAESSYVFGNFRLIPEQQLLLRHNQPVRIGHRALDILTLLVRRSGELVSKAEIDAYVWPDTYVEEGNIKVNVAVLRKVLNEDDDGARYITSVQGRGYRFIHPVEVEVPPRALLARSSLPMQASDRFRVIGREQEIAAITDAMSRASLVTIVGPGGVGKTTAAVAVARQMSEGGGIEPCFVDLASLEDSQLVSHAIAGALGIRVKLSDPLGGIRDHLRGDPRLIVLDNCEHLLTAVAAAADYLTSSLEKPVFLATSREPLRVKHEHVFRLQPLAYPEADVPVTAAAALSYPAVELFVARASERNEYSLLEEDAESICTICRRLDGMPLAIELTATRIENQRPGELLRQLQESYFANQGAGEGPARQQTLLATIEWSYRLLTETEARVMRFVSVYAGAFGLEDVVAMVCAEGIDAAMAVAAIENLVQKSLVSAEVSAGARRYRMLESSRRYSLGMLTLYGELERAGRSHAAHLLTVFEKAESEWHWRLADEWLAEYRNRAQDLRRALTWAFEESRDPLMGIALTVAAIPLWAELALVGESKLRMSAAMEAARRVPACDALRRTKLAYAYAWSLTNAAPISLAAVDAWAECRRLANEASNSDYQIRAIWGMAVYEYFTGRPAAAACLAADMVATAQQSHDWSAYAEGTRMLAQFRSYTGEISVASEILEPLVQRYDRPAERARHARFQSELYEVARCTLAFIRWLEGNIDQAVEASAAALGAAIARGHIAMQCHVLGLSELPIALWTDNRPVLERSLSVFRRNFAQERHPVWDCYIRLFGGALRAVEGDATVLDDMRAGVEGLIEFRFEMRIPYYLSLVAEAFIRHERDAEARRLLEDANRRVETHGEHWCLPEILRLQGLIEVKRGEHGAAHAYIERALASAHSMGCRSMSLRCAIDMARFLMARGNHGAALSALRPVYAQFTEGHATKDLIAARGLLESL